MVNWQDKIRPLWRHYFQNTQGLIFVVDSNDRCSHLMTTDIWCDCSFLQGKSRGGKGRIDANACRGRTEGGGKYPSSVFYDILSSLLINCFQVLLIFANKQDLPNAMNAAEITDKLGLHSLRNRNWYIQVRGIVTILIQWRPKCVVVLTKVVTFFHFRQPAPPLVTASTKASTGLATSSRTPLAELFFFTKTESGY